MTIQKALELAVKRGWKPSEAPCNHKLMADESGCPFGFHYPCTEAAVLDPAFWQFLYKQDRSIDIDGNDTMQEAWLYHWHRLIDHLAEGNSIESFFNGLTE